ncbi:MAG TPA: hypothetical protein VFG23_24750, partial [Polyangia bacterium]|nr:hypothetical protein [Polyangia bacterium]
QTQRVSPKARLAAQARPRLIADSTYAACPAIRSTDTHLTAGTANALPTVSRDPGRATAE